MTSRSLDSLLAELRSRDIRLAVDGDALRCDAPKGALTADLAKELKGRKPELIAFLKASQVSETPTLRLGMAEGEVPLSHAQEGAWFIDQIQPGVPFNIIWPMRLFGDLNVRALEATIDEIVQRHAVLRTNFKESNGLPRQVVRAPGKTPINVVNLEGFAHETRDSELLDQVIGLSQQTFDLANDALVNLTLFRMSEQDHMFLFVVHHSVFDGWSLKVFANEFARLYTDHLNGRASSLPALPVQFADYSVWQRQLLQGAYYESQVSYWKKQLASYPASLSLPADRRPDPSKLFQGDVETLEMPADLAVSIRESAQREGVTLFMYLLAAYKAMLMRHSGQEDIVVGTPIANRNQIEMAGVIGFCVNLLALRTDLSGNPSFRELLARERDVCVGGFDHQELPFGLVVQEIEATRQVGSSPIFQVQFAFHDAQEYELSLPGLRLATPAESGAVSDELLRRIINAQPATDQLFWNVIDTPSGFSVLTHYRSDMFDGSSIQQMMQRFHHLLEVVVANPDARLWEIPLQTDAERRQVIGQWRTTSPTASSGENFHYLIEQQARKTPTAVAVSAPAHDGNESEDLTYEALNQRANRLARLLRARGVGLESRVGICLERTPELIVAVLAVIKSGAALVALDVGYGAERLEYLCHDAKLSSVITRSDLAENPLPASPARIELDQLSSELAQESDENLNIAISDQNAAYIVYTSGSTGRPKGVAALHRGLVNAFHGWETSYRLGEMRCHLQMASFSFDVFMGDLARALCSGARLVLCPREVLLDAPKLTDLISDYQVDCGEFVPAVVRTLFNHLEETDQKLDSLKLALVGSDSWHSAEYLQLVRALGDGARVVNSYGVAEGTIDSTFFEDATRELTEDRPLPIGRPFAGVEVLVLDRLFRPTPVGVPGELCLGGAGVTRGYLDRPELTAERFVPHPYSQTPGQRLYRTGDRARFLADGSLEFLGRVDDQIKIRGYRVEPGEIEAVVGEHPNVQKAVVVPKQEAGGENRLVAYVAVGSNPTVRESELRDFVRQKLPNYLVPSQWVLVERFQLTPNGKIDRRALPTPPDPSGDLSEQYVEPRTLTEMQLAEVWKEVLEVERVGVNDDFFMLGGHSLLGARLIIGVRKELKVELPLRALFDHPTVAEMARTIEATRELASSLLPSIEPASRQQDLPLSFAQEGAWFVDQMQPGTPFNIPICIRMRGPLDLELLSQAMNDVVLRHESLRTRFCDEAGTPQQVIDDEIEVPFEFVDLSALPADERERALVRSLIEAGSAPFSLTTGPLVRMTAIRVSEQDHVLFLNAHHIVFDGHSVQIFARDFAVCYEARRNNQPARLPALTIQYADYAIWQRDVLQGEFLEKQIAYWQGQLADYPAGLDLASNRLRANDQMFRGDVETQTLSAELSDNLRSLAQQEGATLFMVLLTAFKALLARYSDQQDIIVGTPIANRSQAEMANVIGFCVNVLPLRTDLSGDPSFRDLLHRVRSVCGGAFSHQEAPFGLLVQKLQPDRHLNQSPYFQVAFALQDAQAMDARLPNGLEISLDFDIDSAREELAAAPVEATPATDHLFLQMVDSGREITAALHHRSDLFDETLIAGMMRRFVRVLENAVSHPQSPFSQVSLLDERETQLVLHEWNETAAERQSDLCVHQLFELQAAKSPDGVAVEFPETGVAWTYCQLNRIANRLAHRLIAAGVTPESCVGVCCERRPELIVAILGALKAGAAYVPLDPDYPDERLQHMLEQTRPLAIITQESLSANLPRHDAIKIDVETLELDDNFPNAEEREDENPNVLIRQGNPAYVIYTSGSTGEPKGVVVTHQGVVNHNLATIGLFALTADDRVLQFHSVSFDAAVEEIFPTLAAGATLVMRGNAMLLPSHDLSNWVEQQQLTVLNLPTAYWHEWVDASQLHQLASPNSLRLVIIGGDAASPQRLSTWNDWTLGGVELLNTYGPTETTVITTGARLATNAEGEWDAITIGRPIENCRVYILDRHLEPAPIGVAGEIYLGGAGLARGYLEHASLTAERFVPDPYCLDRGGRMYRTGDRARFLPDGRIEFLGRVDQQIKIRGFRVEPGEIESALRGHPLVYDALVTAYGNSSEKRLCAYVVTAADSDLDAADLRGFLESQLPSYMNPALFAILSEFPRTSGGKIDRRALPDPSTLRGESGRIITPPRTDVEIRLAGIWCELLDVDEIGVGDNFFELGGHSLLAVRLVSQVRSDFKVDLPLPALFEHPTIAQLAVDIASLPIVLEDGSLAPGMLPLNRGVSRADPLFVIHAADGSVANYLELARELDAVRPVFGLQHPGLAHDDELAFSDDFAVITENHAETILAIQETGPIHLAGWSLGGILAYEVACSLEAAGREVTSLTLLDAWAWDADSQIQASAAAKAEAQKLLGFPAEELLQMSPKKQTEHLLARARALSGVEDNQALVQRLASELGLPTEHLLFLLEESNREQPNPSLTDILSEAKKRFGEPDECRKHELRRQVRVVRSLLSAISKFTLRNYSGPMTLLRVDHGTAMTDPTLGWARVSKNIRVEELPGSHFSMLRKPNVQSLAAWFARQSSGPSIGESN